MSKIAPARHALKHWWQGQSRATRRALKVVIPGLLIVTLGGALVDRSLSGLLLALLVEIIGAISILLLLRARTGARKPDERLKADLIAQLSSPDNSEALQAADDLRRHGWLLDGSLQGAYLWGANLRGARLADARLQGADLSRANLESAHLVRANLHGAQLTGANLCWANLGGAIMPGARLGDANVQEALLIIANLQGARLVKTNLRQARLIHADLRWAFLSDADLRDADLTGADLRSAHLSGARLAGAKLVNTVFDEDATLPDGSRWSRKSDLRRFTDPARPDFWQIENPPSPE